MTRSAFIGGFARKTEGHKTEKHAAKIKDLPEQERPRERLMQYGPRSLSNADLLAIILRTGTTKASAIRLAENLLAKFGSLKGLATADPEDISKMDGVGSAKVAQICAAMELGKRLAAFMEESKPTIRGPEDVAQILMPELRHQTQEHFRALYLDAKNRVLRITSVFVGTLDASTVHPREVFRDAVTLAAAGVIVAHNHPSGDPSPSPEDLAVTRRLHGAGKVVGIDLLDHVIIGDGRWISLKERGMLGE